MRLCWRVAARSITRRAVPTLLLSSAAVGREDIRGRFAKSSFRRKRDRASGDALSDLRDATGDVPKPGRSKLMRWRAAVHSMRLAIGLQWNLQHCLTL